MGHEHRFDHTPFLVKPGQRRVRLKDHDPGYTGGVKDKGEARDALLEDVSALAEAQDVLWASRQFAVILIFQAMDAAGKDGTIKHVMSGVNPQGVTVTAFGPPNERERQHHFLWRPMQALPERGRIAIYNRSYYEEVLVVRVHPEFLGRQWLTAEQRALKPKDLWPVRYDEINAFEKILHRGDTLVLKFFLNVSKKEQRQRLLERLNDPEKNWKFRAGDIRERGHWDEYMAAYEDMLAATSTKHAPWYVIPADKKWFTRACVADILAARIKELGLSYPKVSAEQAAELEEGRRGLEAEEKGA